jgi:hypothetical protein
MGALRRRSKDAPEEIRTPVLVQEKIGKRPRRLGRSSSQVPMRAPV